MRPCPSFVLIAGLVATSLSVNAQQQPQPAAPAPASAPARDRPVATAPASGRIRGIVTSDAGKPLRHAVVRLSGAAMPDAKATATTDLNGAYELREVPQGRYTLSATKPGYVSMQYGQPRAFEPGRPVDVSNGSTIDSINFTLPRGGSIIGRVVDEMGEPVADAAVTAVRFEYVRGRKRLGTINNNRGPARTNEFGEFRLSGLPNADYYVSATLGGAFSDSQQGDPLFAYARTFFPATPNIEEAQAVRVAAEQEATVSIALVPARLIHVSGSLIDSAGRPVTAGVVRLDRQGDPTGSGRVMPLSPDGSFSVEVVAAPGAYVLTASSRPMMMGPRTPERDPEMGRQTLALGSADVTGVLIATSPGGVVSGDVVFENAPATGTMPQVRIYTQPADPDDVTPGGGMAAPMQADRTFEVRSVFGRSLIVADLPRESGWQIKGVYVNGQDVTDTGIDVGARQRLAGVKVVATMQKTEVTGVVTSANGEAQANCVVMLYAEDESRWRNPLQRYFAITRSNQQGQYDITGLPAGKYLAVATQSLDMGSATDPTTLTRLRAGTSALELNYGQKTPLDLRLFTP
jgi:hypothetical protein